MEKLYKIWVSCTGVKKRCRKPDRHSFSLGYIPYNEGSFDKAEIEAKARDFVATNMKSLIGKASVSLNVVEREKDDYGIIESFQMFDPRNITFQLNSTLENELC